MKKFINLKSTLIVTTAVLLSAIVTSKYLHSNDIKKIALSLSYNELIKPEYSKEVSPLNYINQLSTSLESGYIKFMKEQGFDLITIIYWYSLQGEITPCGCSAGQFGGLSRITSVISSLRNIYSDLGKFYIFDLGDLYVQKNIVEKEDLSKRRIKHCQELRDVILKYINTLE